MYMHVLKHVHACMNVHAHATKATYCSETPPVLPWLHCSEGPLHFHGCIYIMMGLCVAMVTLCWGCVLLYGYIMVGPCVAMVTLWWGRVLLWLHCGEARL